MTATNFQKQNALAIEFNAGTTGAIPANWYIGLCTNILSASCTSGSEALEPTDSAYARVHFPATSDYWEVSSSGSAWNISGSSFVESTESWGTIQTAFIADAATLGNIWYFYTLQPSINVQALTTIPISASDVTINML